MIEEGLEYTTRDKRRVRIYSTSGGGSYPVHGAIWNTEEKRWTSQVWTREGAFMSPSRPENADLIPVPRKIVREVWVNVFADHETIHSCKWMADGAMKNNPNKREACVSFVIDCEEGEGLDDE